MVYGRRGTGGEFHLHNLPQQLNVHPVSGRHSLHDRMMLWRMARMMIVVKLTWAESQVLISSPGSSVRTTPEAQTRWDSADPASRSGDGMSP